MIAARANGREDVRPLSKPVRNLVEERLGLSILKLAGADLAVVRWKLAEELCKLPSVSGTRAETRQTYAKWAESNWGNRTQPVRTQSRVCCESRKMRDLRPEALLDAVMMRDAYSVRMRRRPTLIRTFRKHARLFRIKQSSIV
jgi:hypothetical protein